MQAGAATSAPSTGKKPGGMNDLLCSLAASQFFTNFAYMLILGTLAVMGLLFMRFYRFFFDAGALEGSSDLIAAIVFIAVLFLS